jgi:hypothetical protein
MDADLKGRLEVRDAVEAMIKNLASIVERSPATVTPAADFNPLLERARRAFPSSEAIRDMPKVEREGVTLFDLLAKLSILDGAIKADFTARNVAAVADHNQRIRRERGTWLSR